MTQTMLNTSPALVLGVAIVCWIAVATALYVWRWSRRGF